MMDDAALVHAVLAWTVGLTGLLAAGVVAPIVACYLPDAWRLARSIGHPTPVLADLGMVLGLLLMGAVAIHSATAPLFWVLAAIPVAVVVAIAGAVRSACRAARFGRMDADLRTELDRPVRAAH